MQIRPVLAAVVLSMLLGAGCTPSLIAGGQLRPEPFAAIVERTERARGLRFEGPVRADVVDAETFRTIIEKEAEDQWSSEALLDYEEGLIAIGLWPPDRDLLEEFVGALGKAAGGLYLPRENALLIVENPETPMSVRMASFFTRRDLAREVLLTHELVHMLQHQHYPRLIEYVSSNKQQDDVVIALQAAVEGDAVRYGFAAIESGRSAPAPADFARGVEEEARRKPLAERPALVRYSLLFPYAQGYRLAMTEAELLLDRPPVSSEQVLHAEKRREPFIAFDLQAVAQSLPPNCDPVSENTVGEFGLSVLFRDAVIPSGSAITPEVWQGWDGDRYLAARCDGELELFWLTAWDSRADALEFAQGYAAIAEHVQARAGLSSRPNASIEGQRVVVATAGLARIPTRARARLREARVGTLGEVLAFTGDGALAASRLRALP